MTDQENLMQRFGIVGESDAIRQVLKKVNQIAPTDITVLLQGESGVGKDVIARTIHGLSPRKSKSLVIVNCGAIPEGIIESELFGHEKGSFTGAHDTRQGYFEKADGGTIFLDEIGDTPKNVQVKLLRILENGEYYRVGSSQVRTTDVRIIAATNRDLWKDVQKGDFREDLYYRLDTINLRIPPLRDRQDDIPLLFQKFVREFAAKYDSVFQGMSDEARNLLLTYRWPGNIRELRNVAEQLVILEKSQFVDGETIKKYLKGRQHHGSPDNLPMIFENQSKSEDQYSDDQYKRDREMIYRALLEIRSDIGDLKTFLGKLFYNMGADGADIRRALPAIGGSTTDDKDLYHTREPAVQRYDEKEIPVEEDSDENSSGISIDPDNLPTLEEAERVLIESALERFKGNRRRASEALGMSERTLYRKLDIYGLA